MTAALALLKSGGAVAAGVLGWLLADWRRICAALALLAILAAYVVGDVRGRRAEAATWQGKIDALSKAWITAADKAAADEAARQAQIGLEVTEDFDRQDAVRTAEDAAREKALNQEIADHDQATHAAADPGAVLSPDDLDWLQSPAKPAGAAAHGRRR